MNEENNTKEKQGCDEKRKNLLALIHIIKSNLNISDDNYRAALYAVAKKYSAKDLTEEELRSVVKYLSPSQNSFYKPHGSGYQKTAMDGTGFYKNTNTQTENKASENSSSQEADKNKISEKQVSYIKKLWQNVSNVKTVDALNSFIERTTKKTSVYSISKKEASDVITALIKMQNTKNRMHGT